MGCHERRAGARTARFTLACGAFAAAVALVTLSTTVAGAAPGDAAQTQVAPDAVAGTPCSASASACVDLANHQAWLLEDGKVVRGPVPVQDGASDEPTPPGTYRVEWKADKWVSREYGTPMPWSVFFAPGGISFHEGPPDTPSAGCVKLGPEDAHAWYDFLQVGDEVQVR